MHIYTNYYHLQVEQMVDKEEKMNGDLFVTLIILIIFYYSYVAA